MAVHGITQVSSFTNFCRRPCLCNNIISLISFFVIEVESYNVETDQWTSGPSLNLAKGSLGGVSIGNKLFAIGGGNGIESFPDVEMLDLDLGRWICTRSMQQRVILSFWHVCHVHFKFIHLYDNSFHSVNFVK